MLLAYIRILILASVVVRNALEPVSRRQSENLSFEDPKLVAQ
jgi:hypothetical protein